MELACRELGEETRRNVLGAAQSVGRWDAMLIAVSDELLFI
jgi:hypothetical protein